MRNAIKAHALFKPPRSKSETKADITDSQAKAIIGEEASKREAKTAKLREARLKQLREETPEKSSAQTGKSDKPRIRRAVSSM